jgi:hypothetical protein
LADGLPYGLRGEQQQDRLGCARGARHLLGENFRTSCFGQCIALQGKVLVYGRHAGVAEQHGFVRDDAISGIMATGIAIGGSEIACDYGCAYAEEFTATIPAATLRASTGGLAVSPNSRSCFTNSNLSSAKQLRPKNHRLAERVARRPLPVGSSENKSVEAPAAPYRRAAPSFDLRATTLVAATVARYRGVVRPGPNRRKMIAPLVSASSQHSAGVDMSCLRRAWRGS